MTDLKKMRERIAALERLAEDQKGKPEGTAAASKAAELRAKYLSKPETGSRVNKVTVNGTEVPLHDIIINTEAFYEAFNSFDFESFWDDLHRDVNRAWQQSTGQQPKDPRDTIKVDLDGSAQVFHDNDDVFCSNCRWQGKWGALNEAALGKIFGHEAVTRTCPQCGSPATRIYRHVKPSHDHRGDAFRGAGVDVSTHRPTWGNRKRPPKPTKEELIRVWMATYNYTREEAEEMYEMRFGDE